MSGDGLQEPVLVPPRGLVPAVLCALALTAIAAVLWPGGLAPATRPSLALSGWSPPVEELAAIEARRARLVASQRGDDGARQALEADIIKGLVQWLGREQQLGFEGARHDALSRLGLARAEEDMRTLALRYGNEAVRALGVRWAREVREQLVAVLVAMQTEGQVFAAAVSATPPPAVLAGFQETAPGMARALAQAGLDHLLLDPKLGSAASLVVEALVEQRVLQLCQRVPPPRPELASDLSRLLLRFRVEAHTGLTLRRRLELLDHLAAVDPSYPAAYVTAVLLARAGRWRAARAGFQDAARRGQMPALARANARMCRERLSLLGDR